MSSYIGQLGRLVKLKCPSSQGMTPAERYSFSQTLEGRVKAQVSPVSRRSWSVGISTATPADIGALTSFSSGEWGPGPFVWIAEGSTSVNMITPSGASCDPLLARAGNNTMAGPLQLPDGSWAGRSIVNSDPSLIMTFSQEYVPVIEGTPVTASAYVRGTDAGVRVYFYNSAGTQIGNSTSPMRATPAAAVRCWVTTTAPAGAVSCRMFGYLADQGTRPAITWTPDLREWGDGMGCEKAVVADSGIQLVLAIDQPTNGHYSDASFTIREVG